MEFEFQTLKYNQALLQTFQGSSTSPLGITVERKAMHKILDAAKLVVYLYFM